MQSRALLRMMNETKQGKGRLLIGVLGGSLLLIVIIVNLVWFSGRINHGIYSGGVALGRLTQEEAVTRLAAYYDPMLKRKIILEYQNRKFGVISNRIGLQPDYEQTVAEAYRVGGRGSLWRSWREWLKPNGQGREVELVLKYDYDRLDTFYRLIEAGVGSVPVRSMVLLGKTGKVSYSSSKDGLTIQREELLRRLEEAMVSPQLKPVAIPVSVVKPWLTEADIERWELNKVLGNFETKFDPTKKERVHNLRVAAECLDNVVIYPGQQISFNTWVGPRVTESGYKEATVILDGKLVPGVGGGVCQVSSTLYNAALLANLKIVQRRNHTLPIAYLPMGQDAAVADGWLDFVFENTLETPLLLVTAVEEGVLRMGIMGKKQGWETVEIETKVLETYPYEVVETFDDKLKENQRIKEAEGYPGYKVALYRKVMYPDGTFERRLENTSIYPPRSEKYKVGAGSKIVGGE